MIDVIFMFKVVRVRMKYVLLFNKNERTCFVNTACCIIKIVQDLKSTRMYDFL